MSTSPLPALPPSVRTLPELLAWRAALSPDAEAYRQFDADSARWVSVTWAEMRGRVTRWTDALATLALPRGARIAILLPNGLDAVCIDQAALALACVPVPLHAIDNPQSIGYILGDSEAALLVAASDTQWHAIAALNLSLPSLREVVVLRVEGAAEAAPAAPVAPPVMAPVMAPVTPLARWLERARAEHAPIDGPTPNDDLAALVYTSGTTGKPKGVMLTHANVIANVDAALARVTPLASDVFLSFLPLSHTFERTAGYYLPMAAGSCVAYARSVAQLAEDLTSVRPTILISVPRIYERVYAKLQETLAGSALRKRLFDATVALGWRRFCRVQRLAVPPGGSRVLDALAWPLLERLVARRVLAAFGGRLRVSVSGGAPLAQPIARCFLALGLPLLQGYGMTESSPVVAVNAPDDNDPATVGRALRGVELRIGANQELLVRGPNVMRGYWKRADDTARTLVDGWLHTGDQAAIEAGRVRILGRVKEIIVTSTGEKIAPADLELAIGTDPLFEQACVFGDNRPFIACIVVLNPREWARLAATLTLDPADPSSLRAKPALAAMLARIEALTRAFPRYAQPRAVWPTLESWTTENTLLTPTLKIKRNNIAARYAAQIDALYARRQ